MAHRITDECTYCAACEPECPVSAITAGDDIYIIDENACVDCEGYFDEAACVVVCPVDCIIKV
ncbi:MAG: ferredoxin [Prosthecochloris sp.]|nr:ferredoxin [Prosthecochloris sp.]